MCQTHLLQESKNKLDSSALYIKENQVFVPVFYILNILNDFLINK